MKKSGLLALITVLSLNLALTQEMDKRMLEGTIIADGKPLIGATVLLLNDLENGVVSDLDGKFKIPVDKDKSFKIRLGICICAKRPKDIKVKKNEKELVLKLNKCNFSKKVKRRIGKCRK